MSDGKDEFYVDGYDDESRTVTGVRVHPDGREQPGTLFPMQEGAPLSDGVEIVQARPSGERGVLGIQSLYKHKGPARVTTPAYRQNYDDIFGKNTDKSVN